SVRCDFVFFFSSRRRHTRFSRDWSSDVCSSDLLALIRGENLLLRPPVENMAGRWLPHEQQAVGDFLGLAVIGGPQKVRARLEVRSEEHTSELQSRENLVCRLLLEKKNTEIQFLE